jgi:hypothetical protein
MRELLKLGDRPLHFPPDKVETTWSQIYWPGENFEASQSARRWFCSKGPGSRFIT